MLRAAVAEYLQARAAQLEHVSDDLAIVLQACTDPDFRQGRRPASRSSAPDPLS